MLAYSKQRKPDVQMENLTQLLTELVDFVQKQYDGKGVALVTDFDEDMPPVPVDAGGLHQAMLNMLNNALDAVEENDGVVSLRSRFNADAGQFVIDVVDNGEGMSKATQQNLFEPFLSTKGYGGTGLGLVVTKKIVDEHGGRIEVQSQKGEGTTFTLYFPAHVDAIPAAADTHGPS